MAFYRFRRMIRKLPGKVIHAVPIPDPVVTEGFGAREKIGSICKEMGCRSVLLVTDKTVFGLGFHEKITASLEKSGIAYTIFSDIASEPTVDIIRAGKKAAVACGADCVVALGGGSVLDSSKIIAAGAKTPKKSVTRYLHKFALVPGKTLPLITVPSTSGTGAEFTVGAVVKHDRGVKACTVVVGLDVEHVVLDSELTVNAPLDVTVWCGIDALSHGLEGLMADTESGEENVRESRECVKLALENLPVLLEDPHNVGARQAMSRAAHFGGNAINRQLAGYVHAFAHSIGALYHIPHGKAIAWCLIPVTRFQKELCLPALAGLASYCGLASDAGAEAEEDAADRIIEALGRLLEECGLEKGCAALKEEDYDKLVGMIDADSINYSPPKTLTDEEIRALLDAIKKGD